MLLLKIALKERPKWAVNAIKKWIQANAKQCWKWASGCQNRSSVKKKTMFTLSLNWPVLMPVQKLKLL